MTQDPAPYFPQLVFDRGGKELPRVFASPQRYVQGPGVLGELGKYLSSLGLRSAGILISKGGKGRFGSSLEEGLKANDVSPTYSSFGGECSLEQIERSVAELREGSPALDVLVAVGGGKCIDAGKAMAYRLGVPCLVVPTLASTDAPCSALSVIYTPQGVMSSAEFYPENPILVLMDTEIILKTTPRYLVAGMADALATWYEARVCIANPNAGSTLGARPTLLAAATGKLCADTIYGNADDALTAMAEGQINDAFEAVVEANTLHSGIGFESGGLAGAHALASALTALPNVDAIAMHGEMVAMGVLSQLVLEHDEPEYERALDLFMRVGLPVHLGHFDLDWSRDAQAISQVVAIACANPLMSNFDFAVDEDLYGRALQKADRLGRERSAHGGDAAFAALRAG